MSETWLPWCVKRPGPAKGGYGGNNFRSLAEIEGEVKHSTEGSLAAAFGELDRLTREASWHFTIDVDGTVYQHYPLEWIAWHCGGPGDRRADTSLIGNITLIGEEHVDRINGVSEFSVLLEPQITSSARISRDVRALCPRVAANPPTLRVNWWEHGWLSSTACPSGLIPWPILKQATEEDNVTQDEFNAMAEKWIRGHVGQDGLGAFFTKLLQADGDLAKRISDHAATPHSGGLKRGDTVKLD